MRDETMAARTYSFVDPATGNTQTVRVWLPEGYDENATPDYPTIHGRAGTTAVAPCRDSWTDIRNAIICGELPTPAVLMLLQSDDDF